MTARVDLASVLRLGTTGGMHIAGALLGGFIGRALNLYRQDEPARFVMAFVGAVLLLAGYRMMAGLAAHDVVGSVAYQSR